MEHATRQQTIALMFLLMVSTIFVDSALESSLRDPIRTSVLAFSFIMAMFWILEQGGLEKWPKRTVSRKVAMAVPAALAPLVMYILQEWRR